MLYLLFNGEFDKFVLFLIILIISLSFHEFGHAYVAKLFGDDTAQRAGRLTINPIAHIDPLGLLMVISVGFGYAKPVPTDPRNFNSPWASPMVALAGPLMNFFLAIVAINIYYWGLKSGIASITGPGQTLFFNFLALINLLLMIFNLIPLGALDGHCILPHLLPKKLAYRYEVFNVKYGNMVLLSLIVLSIMGLPIFGTLMGFSQQLLPYITFM